MHRLAYARDHRAADLGDSIDPVLLLWSMVDALSATAVWVFDRGCRVAWCSRECSKIFGYDDPNGLVGQRPGEFLPASWAREREALITRCLEEGRPFTLLSIISGERRAIRFIPVSLTPGEESPTHVLSVVEMIDADRVDRLLRSDHKGSVIRSRVHDLGILNVLSPRELEVLALMGRGLRSKEIAASLNRSVSTIEGHRERIGAKLGVSDRAELLAIARRAALMGEDAEDERVSLYPHGLGR